MAGRFFTENSAPISENRNLHVLLIIFLGLAVYSNTFESPFVFDDTSNIIENHNIRDIFNIPGMFTDIGTLMGSRPLTLASFAVDFRLWGLNTYGYHLSNLLIHLINGLLLYRLVIMTGELRGFSGRDVMALAFFSSLIFVAHPVQTEAVTYIVSRSMLLATLFYLLGIILFVTAVKAGSRRHFYAGALFIASLMGMASREDFVTFPVMLLLYDYFFVSRRGIKGVAPNLRIHLLVFSSLFYLAFLVSSYKYEAAGFEVKSLTPFQYLMTQFNVLWTYLRLLLLPVNQNLDYDYPAARTLFEMPTFVFCIGYIGLWALAVYLVRKRPIASFCMLWFLVAITPASSFVPLVDVVFEHRLYLPSAGPAVAFVMLLQHMASRMREKSGFLKDGFIPLTVAVLLFASAAHVRNFVWQDELILWQDAVEKSPVKARPYNNVASAYMRKGADGMARESLLRALELNPDYTVALNNIADIYMKEGKNDPARELLLKAIRIKPSARSYTLLGLLFLDQGMADKAIGQFKEALVLNPAYTDARNNLGLAYLKTGKWDEAIGHFNLTLDMEPGYSVAYYNLGLAYLGLGYNGVAKKNLEIFIRLNPMDSDGWYNLGRAAEGLGEVKKAAIFYNLALKLDPMNREARKKVGRLNAEPPSAPRKHVPFVEEEGQVSGV